MSAVRRAVWALADPGFVSVVAVGILFGGFGATYPTAFLGESHAPGTAAGVLLGAVGALASAPIWAFAVGLSAAASPSSQALRLVHHAQGRGPLRMRMIELFSAASRLAAGAVAGSIGGFVSAACQRTKLADPQGLFALAPSAHALVTAATVALLSMFTGYLVGTAAGDASAGLLIVTAVLALSAVLVGAAYFTPSIGTTASMTPLGILLVATRDQIVAPQFTEELSTVPAQIGVLLWAVVVVAFAVLRTRRQVA